MRVKINLDTQTSVLELVNIASKIEEDVFITDKDHKLIVSAKSILGARYAQIEWHDLYLECEKDIYREITEFIAE